jgi:transcription elongation factor Elf1
VAVEPEAGDETVSVHISGQFGSDFPAFIECAECGEYVQVLVRHDPEAILPWAFDCPDCGYENRPDFTEDDPDRRQ